MILSPQSYPETFSLPEIFRNTVQTGCSTKLFSTVRPKNFRRKILMLPYLLSVQFCYRKISETQYRRVHLRNFSALRDNKFLTENRDTPSLPPPLLSLCFFDTRNFVKHRGLPHLVFWCCEKTGFRRKILILCPPPPLINKLFRYRKFSQTQYRRVPVRNFSAL